MSAVTRPRGPLPARVYWTRRTLVVVLALVLVFVLARLLGGSGSGGGQPSAQPVGADASSSSAAATTSAAASSPTAVSTAATVPATSGAATSAPSAATGAAGGKQASSTPLPGSSGPCRTDDIVATPTIKGTAYAGKPVVFAMDLTTRTTAACDFVVSARSLVVKISSGADRIWSTQDCRGAVPKQSVVVRKDTPTSVDVTWNGQRSDSACSRSTSWAEPGYYHAVSAAFGSDPVDEQFRLLAPVRPTVTAKPKPKPSSKASGKPSSKPSPTATSKPSKH